jgi:tetratricopeptide (TPR) repeat protein
MLPISQTNPAASASGSMATTPSSAAGMPPLIPTSGEKPVGKAPVTASGETPQDRLTVKFNIPPDFVAQGEALEAQGHHAEAVRLFQKALQQDPQNLAAWRDMGDVYRLLRQNKYAVQCYERVLKLRPGDKVFEQWVRNYKAQNP